MASQEQPQALGPHDFDQIGIEVRAREMDLRVDTLQQVEPDYGFPA